MRNHLIDRARPRRKGSKLMAYSRVLHREKGPFSAMFETVFRRARPESGSKLPRFLAIARQG